MLFLIKSGFEKPEISSTFRSRKRGKIEMEVKKLKKQVIKFGSIAGILHIIFLIIFFGYINSEQIEKSQSAFYWLIWFGLDFPVSLLITSETVVNFLKLILMTDSMDIVYLIFHGIIGSLWWGVLVGFVYYIYQSN